LRGVVIHRGDTFDYGHYYSFIKADISFDNSWYKFNDSSVTYVGNFPEE